MRSSRVSCIRGRRKFGVALKRDVNSGTGRVHHARLLVEGWTSAFRLWPGARDWRLQMLGKAERVMASPPPRERHRSRRTGRSEESAADIASVG